MDSLFLIANGFAKIIATIRTVFWGCPREMYWAHVVRNVDKKLLWVRNEEIKLGPPSFAICNIYEIFRDAWGLFKVYYTPNRKVIAVVQYVQDT